MPQLSDEAGLHVAGGAATAGGGLPAAASSAAAQAADVLQLPEVVTVLDLMMASQSEAGGGTMVENTSSVAAEGRHAAGDNGSGSKGRAVGRKRGRKQPVQPLQQ